MQYKILASDYDNTLVPFGESKPRQKVVKAVKKLQAAGGRFVLSTMLRRHCRKGRVGHIDQVAVLIFTVHTVQPDAVHLLVAPIIGDVREDGVAALIEELWFDGPRAEPSGKDFGSAWGNIESAGGSL